MRWVPFLILTYIALVLQSWLGLLVGVDVPGLGWATPDLLGCIAVAVALWAPSVTVAMLGGWVLGFALDMTVTGGTQAGIVAGPMSVAYVIGVRVLYGFREMVFNDRAVVRVMLGMGFCFIVHTIWVFAQTLLCMAWMDFPRLMGQALGVSIYTGLLTPIVCAMLWPGRTMLFDMPIQTRRSRRSRH